MVDEKHTDKEAEERDKDHDRWAKVRDSGML